MSLAKSLIDAFLDSDGKPISQSATYDESEGWLTEFNNRDPRLSATTSAPTSILIDTFPPIPDSEISGWGIAVSGYLLEKHWEFNETEFNLAEKAAYDAIEYRYGEILLIYAEAAAELGIVDQAMIDKSINQLRDRVGLPHMVIADLVKDVDSDFPGLDVVTDEIRRERRVELACEGFRYNDLMRWKAGSVLVKAYKGMLFNPTMYPNIDLATASLTLDIDGYIWPYAVTYPSGRVFDEGKHYLFPIPTEELVMNENLVQNPGW